MTLRFYTGRIGYRGEDGLPVTRRTVTHPAGLLFAPSDPLLSWGLAERPTGRHAMTIALRSSPPSSPPSTSRSGGMGRPPVAPTEPPWTGGIVTPPVVPTVVPTVAPPLPPPSPAAVRALLAAPSGPHRTPTFVHAVTSWSRISCASMLLTPGGQRGRGSCRAARRRRHEREDVPRYRDRPLCRTACPPSQSLPAPLPRDRARSGSIPWSPLISRHWVKYP